MLYRYAFKKVAYLLVTLFFVCAITFFLINCLPGAKADLILKYAISGFDASSTPTELQEISTRYNLDEPLYSQFIDWLENLFLHGSLGTSIVYQKPVSHMIALRLPATILLATSSILLAIVVSVPLGIYSALKKNRLSDNIIRIVTLFGKSMPNFWVGLLLIIVFAVSLRLLPVAGYGQPVNLILPTIALGLQPLATITRITRASILEILGTDYIRFAISKGLSQFKIIFRHAMRNAVLPIVTVIGYQFGYMIGGSMVIESIFAWPGIGSLLVNAITDRDFPMMMGSVMTIVTLFILINLLIDLLYMFIDPKIRYE